MAVVLVLWPDAGHPHTTCHAPHSALRLLLRFVAVGAAVEYPRDAVVPAVTHFQRGNAGKEALEFPLHHLVYVAQGGAEGCRTQRAEGGVAIEGDDEADKEAFSEAQAVVEAEEEVVAEDGVGEGDGWRRRESVPERGEEGMDGVGGDGERGEYGALHGVR